MEKELVIIVAEDDEGHGVLIKKNLKKSGILNEIIHFRDGEAVLNFFFKRGDALQRKSGQAYILLLDIRMPKVDCMEVLRRMKEDTELKKIPVIIITTTDDPKEIETCHTLGCNNYITKPIDYNQFVDVINRLGLFIRIIGIPKINGESYDE